MVSIHVWPFDTHANEYIPGANCSFPRAVSAGLQRDNCRFHLTGWLKDRAESCLVLKPGCFPALFPVKIQDAEAPPPHVPVWAAGSTLVAGAQSCSSRAEQAACWSWAETTQAQRGLLTPVFLWRDVSTWRLPPWGSSFETSWKELSL